MRTRAIAVLLLMLFVVALPASIDAQERGGGGREDPPDAPYAWDRDDFDTDGVPSCTTIDLPGVEVTICDDNGNPDDYRGDIPTDLETEEEADEWCLFNFNRMDGTSIKIGCFGGS